MKKTIGDKLFMSCFVSIVVIWAVLFCVFLLTIGVLDKPINSIFSNKDLKNPTYDEMISFIENDTIDENEYVHNDYNCYHFTNDVLDNAREQGMKAGFVHVFYSVGADHAIVCFDTSDMGLYFLEPQADLFWNETQYSYNHDYDIRRWNSDLI